MKTKLLIIIIFGLYLNGFGQTNYLSTYLKDSVDKKIVMIIEFSEENNYIGDTSLFNRDSLPEKFKYNSPEDNVCMTKKDFNEYFKKIFQDYYDWCTKDSVVTTLRYVIEEYTTKEKDSAFCFEGAYHYGWKIYKDIPQLISSESYYYKHTDEIDTTPPEKYIRIEEIKEPLIEPSFIGFYEFLNNKLK